MTHQTTPAERIDLLRTAIARAEAELERLRCQAAAEIVAELESGERSTTLMDIRHRRMVLQDDLAGLQDALRVVETSR